MFDKTIKTLTIVPNRFALLQTNEPTGEAIIPTHFADLTKGIASRSFSYEFRRVVSFGNKFSFLLAQDIFN